MSSIFNYSQHNFYKFFFINSVSISILFAGTNSDYIGCGSDETIAREELAKSISITVKTSFDKQEAITDDKATRYLSSVSNQSTNLNLIDVVIQKQNDNQICAIVSKDSLRKSLESAKIEIKDFKSSMLIGSPEQKRKTLNQKIEICESGIKLASLFADAQAGTLFQNKLTEFQQIIDNDNFQSVKFNIEGGSGLEIFIDGNNQSHKINESISISSGSHQYKISGTNICDINGNFDIYKNENIIINNISVAEYIRPKVSFTTNQNVSYVKLNVDGDEVAVNREVILKKCSGNIPYSASYNDGTYTDLARGSVENIEPNINKTIHLPFLSIGDIKAMKNEIDTYMNGQRIEFLYSYSMKTISANDQKDYDLKKHTNNFEINLLTHKRFFRYGYGFMIGADNFSEPTNKLIESYMYGAIQFSSFGQYDLPLRIGSVSLIPYLGMKIGVGFHEYITADGEKAWNHPAEGDDDYKYVPDKYEFDFERDLWLMKPIVGIDFIISKGFAFKIYGEQSLKIDKRLHIGTGLSVEF